MILAILEAFREAYDLTIEGIARQVNISESTLTKHRSHPEMKISVSVSARICNYVLNEIEQRIDTMNPDKRLYLMQNLSTNA